jgi:branched-subunit amino acid aminotransferase/4-amino-4-deoxychorismate lyase
MSESGASEAFVLDDEGYIAEGLSSNICWVRGGEVGLSPQSPQILAGITQVAVVELATELGLSVKEERLRPNELVAVDEVFICSSLRELVPVVEIDGVRIGNGVPGPIFGALLRAYRARALRLARAHLLA